MSSSEPAAAPAAPAPAPSSARRTWLPLGAVVLVIVAVVGGGAVTRAALGDPPPPPPVDVAPGVRVQPLGGWEVVEEVEPNGPVVITNGAVRLHVFTATGATDPTTLLGQFLEQVLQPDVPNVAVSDTETLTLPSGPAARVLYFGTPEGANTALEGELTVVVAEGGTGAAFLGAAPEGLYLPEQQAVRTMVETAEVG